MQGPTPSPGYFEKLLVDDGAMELVGGDDQGQHTAVNDELHAELIIVRAKVGFHNFSQNRFVSCVFTSEHLESSSHISQARALQDDVVDVFEEFLTPAWLQKTDSIPWLTRTYRVSHSDNTQSGTLPGSWKPWPDKDYHPGR